MRSLKDVFQSGKWYSLGLLIYGIGFVLPSANVYGSQLVGHECARVIWEKLFTPQDIDSVSQLLILAYVNLSNIFVLLALILKLLKKQPAWIFYLLLASLFSSLYWLHTDALSEGKLLVGYFVWVLGIFLMTLASFHMSFPQRKQTLKG